MYIYIYISTFGAKNTPESWAFEAQNDAQTTSEQLQTYFQNVQKTGFLTLKMVKMTLKEAQILTYNFNFRGHISTYRAKNRPESEACKA